MITTIISFFLLSSIYFLLSSSGLNHKKLFLFGINYYFILPLFVGCNYNIFKLAAFDNWHDVFINVTEEQKEFLLFYSIILVLFYFFGSWLASHLCKKKGFLDMQGVCSIKGLGTTSSIILLIPAIMVTVVIWYYARDAFFKGYSGEYDIGIRGKMSTLALLWLVISFSLRPSINRYIIYFSIVLLILNNVLLLSMGGRMYVIVSAVYILMWFYDRKKLPGRVIIYFLLLSLFLVLVGVIRSGDFNINMLSYIALAEPVYTSFSLFSFLSNDSNFNIFNYPYNYINSFLLILPDVNSYKTGAELTLNDVGFDFISPVGATSFFASLIGNFGVVGGVFFISMLSFFLELLLHSRSMILRNMYLISCAIIPFMLFRDGFSVVTKVTVFSGFIIPFIMFTLSFFLIKLKSNATSANKSDHTQNKRG
ncbi:hypothetical protein [Yersinia sp. IP36721]|uniref:hypothetical protein n=1 Tax=Yersinia sp. IP36721 TaxID=2161716 RepID=UPI000EB221E2|nr:hypothetical protein [Yersinia sp. IP36721]